MLQILAIDCVVDGENRARQLGKHELDDGVAVMSGVECVNESPRVHGSGLIRLNAVVVPLINLPVAKCVGYGRQSCVVDG